MIKRMLLVPLLCLCLGLIFLTIAPSTGYACSCAGPSSVIEELEHSKAVFTGIVLDIRERKSFEGYVTKKVLFDVSLSWKGVSESQIIIVTGQGGGDCGFEFRIGEEYLVYANKSPLYGENEALSTGICDRTTEISVAAEDILILGKGETPNKVVDLTNKMQNSWLYSLWITACILVAGLIIYLIWKRKKA
ncbi:hypothetical protein ACFYKX_05190 [Cytobacillus sp. FJAT-54145]|uniref:Tissue inhibitor of metalloproteinase n=1 Tax=Cytobacillus spartinae TaxID=3299023 RepID=A0ABW6K767_9BACI